MSDIAIVYWRDIPAQIIAGRGRRAIKIQLPQRFEQAIDRAAMADGATGTDAYLADWHKAPATALAEADDTAEDVARSLAHRLDHEYDMPRLNALIANRGRA